MKIQRIVVPTDFSEASLEAVRVGTQWAQSFHAALHLVHVVAIHPVMAPSPEFTVIDDRYDEILQGDAERELRHIASGLKGIETSCTVRRGRPAKEIAAFAAELGTDLIIMATHGRTGFRRMVLGSTTEEVVRIASCPVVSVHRHVQPLQPLSNIAEASMPTL